MKTMIVVVAIAVCVCSSFAQIPNADFETWTSSTTPSGWLCTTSAYWTTIERSSDAHGGSYALKGEVGTYYSITMPAEIFAGTDGRGFPYSSRPASLTGWYKFSTPSGSGDLFYVITYMYKGSGSTRTVIGGGSLEFRTNTSAYTQFSLPLYFVTADQPDTAYIWVGISTDSSTYSTSTYFLLDDLAFSSSNDVPDQKATTPLTFALEQNYPNPFNPTTVISGQWTADSWVKLAVYDMVGREVAILANGQYPAGRHSFTFDARGLASGVYFYRLTAGAYTATKQMILLK